MKKVSVSELRADAYRLIDGVINSQEALYVQRGDKTLVLTIYSPPVDKAKRKRSIFSRLSKRSASEVLEGDPQSLVEVSWEYQPDDIS